MINGDTFSSELSVEGKERKVEEVALLELATKLLLFDSKSSLQVTLIRVCTRAMEDNFHSRSTALF